MCVPNITSVDLVLSRGYDLTGQVHVITGGDSGIGFGIALGLAKANGRIIFLGHNMSKTAVAMEKISQRTKNDKLSAIHLDLMSFASVQSAVAAILKRTNRVDAVICDAGLTHPIQPALTADGFESVVQVQYLSHFYLVELLLPLLRKTKGRVVHTSSLEIDSYAVCMKSGLPEGCIFSANLSDIVRKPNTKGGFPGIIDGNIFLSFWMKTMHARILAHNEAVYGVLAFSFHPGWVNDSRDFQGNFLLDNACSSSIRDMPDKLIPGQEAACENNPAWKHVADQCRFVPWYMCLCSGPDGVETSCPLKSEQGGVTGTYLAAAPQSELAHINGGFTVACGYIPVVYGDPYIEMVKQIGSSGVVDFLERFYDMSLSWIPKLVGRVGIDSTEDRSLVLTI